MIQPYRKALGLLITILTITACSNYNKVETSERTIQCDELTAKLIFKGNSARLIMSNETAYSLTRVVTASGEKYQGSTALVWLKGSDALLEINHKRMSHCQFIE